jgi:hypothetical protein
MRSSTEFNTFHFIASPNTHERAYGEREATSQSRVIRDWGIEIAIERNAADLPPIERF